MTAIDWNPSLRKLREFGLIGGALAWALALYLGIRHELSAPVMGLAALGAILVGLAIARPQALRLVFLALTLVTFPIGWLVSQLVLAVIWFGVFTPLALVFRLIGRDALMRKYDLAAKTYWQPRTAARGPEQYLRQF